LSRGHLSGWEAGATRKTQPSHSLESPSPYRIMNAPQRCGVDLAELVVDVELVCGLWREIQEGGAMMIQVHADMAGLKGKNSCTVHTTAGDAKSLSSTCIAQSYCIDASPHVRGSRAESFAQDLATPAPRRHQAPKRLQDDSTRGDAPRWGVSQEPAPSSLCNLPGLLHVETSSKQDAH
jgi:hypothetical protein